MVSSLAISYYLVSLSKTVLMSLCDVYDFEGNEKAEMDIRLRDGIVLNDVELFDDDLVDSGAIYH